MTPEENDAKALTLIASITTIYKSYEEEKLCDYFWEFAELYASIAIARDVFNHSEWQSTEIIGFLDTITERDKRIGDLESALHKSKIEAHIHHKNLTYIRTGLSEPTLNSRPETEWDDIPKLELETTDNAD